MKTNDPVRAATEAFTNDITALIKRAALDAVSAALGGAAAKAAKAAPAKKAAPAAKAPGRKAAAKAPAKAPAKAAKAPAKKGGKRPLGTKRPPAELAALVEKLGAYIKSNPGQGVEAIGKAINIPTKELTLPIKKLLAGKRVRYEGVKRATKYYPA